jgi:hypothetical protein
VPAELSALVQTYRAFQAAADCRENDRRLSRELADVNDRLSVSLHSASVSAQEIASRSSFRTRTSFMIRTTVGTAGAAAKMSRRLEDQCGYGGSRVRAKLGQHLSSL